MTAVSMATPASAALVRRRWWQRRKNWRQAGRYAAAVIITIFFLFPVYWLFATAFKSPNEVFATPPVWLPSELSFDSFRLLIRDGDWLTVVNSLIIAGSSTLLAMFFGTICAYSIARFRTGGDGLALWIISQRMIPPIAIVFPLFLMYAILGWIDSFHGLILLYTAFNLPYVIWMMRGYIEDIPIELEQSALVDGWTRWQMLLRVVFPMARAGLFATAVFTFIFAWNDFIFALILTRTEVTTFPVQLTRFFGHQQTFWQKVGAMSFIGTLPIFFAVAAMQRFIVRGISLGAIKG
ncbi:MAG: carbohydrate ABC transporter permease [Alphaproteobacteria bacterium]